MSKKKPPKALGAEDLGVEILSSIDAEFRDADDRVMAVVGAAYLDSILEQLLRAVFLNDEEEADKLLAPDRPIGANGARYQLAYCLGLIDSDQRDDLKTIAKVRNLFAHNYSVTSFDDERGRALLASLHFTKRRAANAKQLAARRQKPDSGHTVTTPPINRMLFRDAVFEQFVLLLPKVRGVHRASTSTWFPQATGVDGSQVTPSK